MTKTLTPWQKTVVEDTVEKWTYLEIVFLNTGTTVAMINEMCVMPGDVWREGSPLNTDQYTSEFRIRFEEDVTNLLDPYSIRRQRAGNRLLVRMVE